MKRVRPPLAVYQHVYFRQDGTKPPCLDRSYLQMLKDLGNNIITGDVTEIKCVVGITPCILQHWHNHMPGSPVLLAVEKAPNPAAMVSILLDHRAHPDVVNVESDTALILAAHLGKREVVHVLLDHEHGSRLLDAQDASGMTALHHAALIGDVGMCRDLLKHGASRRVVDDTGRTALDWARLRKGKEVVEALEQQRSTPSLAPDHCSKA